jgi:hypothetical protein
MAKGIKDYGRQYLSKVMAGTHDEDNYAKGATLLKAAGKAPGSPSRGAMQSFQGGEAQGISDAVRPVKMSKP